MSIFDKEGVHIVVTTSKWDHFDILASGKTNYHCKVKKTLIIQDLQPAMNANGSNGKFFVQIFLCSI